MSETLIEVEGLYKIFGDNPEIVMPLIEQGLSKDEILMQTGQTVGLNDINLKIPRGKTFVIMGLSGSGKSTMIRHFNRLIDPTEGRIRVEGVDVMALQQKELEQFRRHKMSMVFQRFGLMPHRTVSENIGYGLSIQGVDKKVIAEKVQYWMQMVGLEGYETHYPAHLSGGQQQRVGLARALCTDAEILLMDEAFSALDPLIRSEMQDQLIELQEKLHKTIIFITHDLDEALRLGDQIAILKDGELVQVGEPSEILLNPATDYVEAFVKDVNRARALTVETVMKPPSCRIDAETIGEALAQMRKLPGDYGYVVNEDGYQGVVLQEALEKAADDDATGKMDSDILEDTSSISPESLIEEVLPETIDTDYPLPVVDKEGDLKGQLSRTSLAEVLSGRGEEKPQSYT